MANRNGIITTSKIVKKITPGIRPKKHIKPLDLAQALVDRGILNYLHLTRLHQVEEHEIERELIKLLKR